MSVTVDTSAAKLHHGVRAPADTPVRVLSEIAPEIVPALYALAERTWPRIRESTRKRFGIISRRTRSGRNAGSLQDTAPALRSGNAKS